MSRRFEPILYAIEHEIVQSIEKHGEQTHLPMGTGSLTRPLQTRITTDGIPGLQPSFFAEDLADLATIDTKAARRLRAWLLIERMNWATELELQDAIDDRLTREVKLGHPITAYTRELRVDEHNRLDFAVQVDGTTVAVEVKIGGSRKDVIRQLTRYAALADVDEILLVTTKASHHRLPTELGGKAVVLCTLVEDSL